MNHRSFFPLFFLLLFLLLPVQGLAQNGMIRGKVRVLNGSTLNDALVELKQETGGLLSQSPTRNDGDFVFSGLRPGNYQITVTLSGYEPTTEAVQLGNTNFIGRGNSDNPGEVVTLEIRLRPKAAAALGTPTSTFVQEIPDAARNAYEKGIAKIREGKSAEGLALLNEAVGKFNTYFDAHFALGSEYYRLGKDKEALESLERARQIYDRGAGVYYVFGMIMVRQQKFRLAEYAFGKAAELNDSYTLAHFNHGVALIEVALRSKDESEIKTMLEESHQELDRAWELSGKRLNTVYLQRARILEKCGDNEAAARELESYLKAEPAAKNAAIVQENIKKLRQKK